MDGRDPRPYELPDLQKWPDIVSLQWQRYASGGNLKYIFRANIQNENTKEMIRKAFSTAGKTEVPLYPGEDFTPVSEQFFGLLGSYHAAGSAYLLAQHRGTFGHKRIGKIKVWSWAHTWPTDGDVDHKEFTGVMMLFVEDVPNTGTNIH